MVLVPDRYAFMFPFPLADGIDGCRALVGVLLWCASLLVVALPALLVGIVDYQLYNLAGYPPLRGKERGDLFIVMHSKSME